MHSCRSRMNGKLWLDQMHGHTTGGNELHPVLLLGASRLPRRWTPVPSADRTFGAWLQAGHLLRTKAATSDEGGVAAGFAVLDSPYLTTD